MFRVVKDVAKLSNTLDTNGMMPDCTMLLYQDPQLHCPVCEYQNIIFTNGKHLAWKKKSILHLESPTLPAATSEPCQNLNSSLEGTTLRLSHTLRVAEMQLARKSSINVVFHSDCKTAHAMILAEQL